MAPSAAARRARRGPAPRLPALLLALACAACSSTGGLTDEDRFELASDNSRSYYDRGSYTQALQQANRALEFEPDDSELRLIKAFCLTKLGKAANNPLMLDEALDIFDEVASTSDGAEDFRTFFGLGSASLARSFEHDHELDRIRKRLASDFLSAKARGEDEIALGTETAARTRCLLRGEAALRRVLLFPLQKDNAFAMVDLVLVLNALGGRDAEAVPLAERALVLLDESTRIVQSTIQRNTKLSAAATLNLEQRIATNREKELLLRDLVATMAYNRGDTEGFLAQMTALEQRKLMGEVQYFNRAEVRESLGQYTEAANDLEAFLRLRVLRLTYDQDAMAPAVFARIESLRARALEQQRASTRR